MKDNRHLQIAIQYGIKEQCEKLEKELLAIDGVTDIDFDLYGFYDNLNQVIFLAKYDVPSDLPYQTYFSEMRRIKETISAVCKDNDLYPSGDAIEDYGAHFYFVRRCGKEWKTK